jgi:hypothetical protein
MKANHHGSSSSVDVNFLAALSPAIVVISSGLKTRFHEHPTQQVMNRLSGTKTAQWYVDGDAGPQVPNSVQNIYVTEVANRVVSEKTGSVRIFNADLRGAKILGDIVVRPIDESVSAVQAATGTAKVPLRVQAYGSGLATDLTHSSSTVRRRDAGTDPHKTYYKVGPWTTTDRH